MYRIKTVTLIFALPSCESIPIDLISCSAVSLILPGLDIDCIYKRKVLKY